MSHDELLAALRHRGITIKSSTLEHWRKQGALPRPLRMWHTGAVRPVYPNWFVGAIELLRSLQDQGIRLEDMTPWLRAYALSPHFQRPSTDKLAAFSTMADLHRALIPFVQGFETGEKHHVATVRITLLDDRGEALQERLIPVNREIVTT